MADSSLLPFPKMNMASWERDATAASAGIGSTVDDEEDDNEDYEKSPQRRSFAQYANEAASRPYAHMPPYSAPPHLGDGYNQFYSLYAPDEQVQRITSQAATYQSTASFAAHPGQQESFSPDENRKPAARPQPEKEKKHVKRHSISSDPYYEQGHAKQVSGFASPPTIQEGTKYSVEFGRSIPRIRSPHDQFINPTMSFGDDDDLREWPDAHIFALQAPEQYVASPPPVASYPPPPPISFSFRDTRVQQSPPLLPPPTLSEAMAPPVPPIRPSRKSRMANRQHIAERLPPIEKIGSHLAFKDLRPSAEEMSAATTPRAQAALEVWYSRLSQLYQYKLEHNGDTNVPQKYKPNPSLGIWVNKQRMEKKFFDEGKKSSMTQRKIQLLESMDFQWAKRKGDTAWMQKFNELREYHREKGDCDVPTKYAPNPALGRWVSTQRSEYKKWLDNNSKHMTMERINKLNKIGFRWEMLPANRSRSDSE